MLIIVLANKVKNLVSPKCPTSTFAEVTCGDWLQRYEATWVAKSQTDMTERLIHKKEILPKKETGTKIILKV